MGDREGAMHVHGPRGPCHNLSSHFASRISPYPHGPSLVILMRKLGFGAASGGTEVRTEAWVVPRASLSELHPALWRLGGRWDLAQDAATPRVRLFLRAGTMSGNPASLQGLSSPARFLITLSCFFRLRSQGGGGARVRAVGALQPSGLGDVRWACRETPRASE